MTNKIKNWLEEKTFYRVTFVVLFVLVQAFCFAAYRHWRACYPEDYWGNVWLKQIIYLVSTLVISILIVAWSEKLERESKAKRLLWVLPVFLVVVEVLILMGFGSMVHGKYVALSFENFSVNYCALAYLFLFLTIPKGIDALIACEERLEGLKMTLYLLVVCALSVFITEGLMLVAICGGFILMYYLYQSHHRYKYAVLAPFVLAVGYVSFYGVNGYFSLRFIKNTWRRLFSGGNSLGESRNYFHPIAMLWDGYGTVAVIVLIAIYVCMGILLWKYVNQFCEQKRSLRFLLVIMFLSWIGAILHEFDVWSILPLNSNPFLWGSGAYVWLSVIYAILHEKRSEA